MEQLKQFLIEHKLAPEVLDYNELTQAFITAMEDGLNGKDSSIKMLPTYCYGDGIPALHTPVAVIDAGGTNFRRVLVTLTETGADFDQLEEQAMPGTHGEVPWSDFITCCADALQPLLEKTKRIGMCFSYPATPQPNKDSRVLYLTKQVQLRDAVGRAVCEDLNAELERRGYKGLEYCLINDTLAVQYGAAAYHHKSPADGMGLVCGTGSNTCCALPVSTISKLHDDSNRLMLVNCESGAFSNIPRGTFDQMLDNASVDPGHYCHEKMVSGAYLGQLCLLALQGAAKSGLFSAESAAYLTNLDALQSYEADGMVGSLAALNGQDQETADAIIEAIFDRSAKITCCCLSAVMTIADGGKEKPFFIGAEGSLFQKSKRFRKHLDHHMEYYTHNTLGRTHTFLTCPSTTFIGTAAAALM